MALGRRGGRFGFVKDPDGNWIEISARASLTGIAPK
jgi:lactoylglutathione lyase